MAGDIVSGFSPNVLGRLLQRYYPRMLGQIDRDPDSRTFGSCDRHYWMYRLHDFESGVLFQAGLTLAYLWKVAQVSPQSTSGCLDAKNSNYWRELARAINRRGVALLSKQPLINEYYPGERSYPGTVFSAYAILKSSLITGDDRVVQSEGLRVTFEALATRKRGPAANQDVAAAAFLALYAKCHPEVADRGVSAARRLSDASGRYREYGGFDLGYASVTLNYLAYCDDDESLDVGHEIDQLSDRIAAFVRPSGRIGGEIAARSTAYFLPYGIYWSAQRRSDWGPLAFLNLTSVFEFFDDRYLCHYSLPSLARTWHDMLQGESAKTPKPAQLWRTASGSIEDDGLFRWSDGHVAMIQVGLNKGGAYLAEGSSEGQQADYGYRIRRGRKVYASCVMHVGGWKVSHDQENWTIEVEAPFQRYAALVPSPLKTVVLRVLGLVGVSPNKLFKRLLITRPEVLPDVRIRRRFEFHSGSAAVTITDRFIGLKSSDIVCRAPPFSLRVVPSARFREAGEEQFALVERSINPDELHPATIRFVT